MEGTLRQERIEKKLIDRCVEFLYYRKKLYAIIIRHDFKSRKIHFFTPGDFSQQLGYLPHKKGGVIKAHVHRKVRREVLYTHEVLFIKKGIVKMNLYTPRKTFLQSEILRKGDIVLLCGGGHGFDILSDALMIEVKQGPYLGGQDKRVFRGVEGKN